MKYIYTPFESEPSVRASFLYVLVKVVVVYLREIDCVAAREYCGLDRSHASGVAGNAGNIIRTFPLTWCIPSSIVVKLACHQLLPLV